MSAKVRASAILVGAACCAGCSGGSSPVEPTGQARSAIIDGIPSPSADDYSVGVEIHRPTKTSFCTGTFIDPRIIVTARHCLLVEIPGLLNCNVDGEPTEGGGAGEPVLPQAVVVNVGSAPPFTQILHGAKIITTSAPSICRDDLAFVVLDGETKGPIAKIRTTSAHIGEKIRFAGWGRTSGDPDAGLPPQRFARDGIEVTEVGPGAIPPRTFAVGGKTLCYGDSGGGALVDGWLVGVFSRIDATECELPTGRNILINTAPFLDVAKQAFDFAGHPVPWDTSDGGVDASPPTSTAPSAQPPPAEIPPLKQSDGGGCDVSPMRGGDRTAGYALIVLWCLAGLRAARRRA